MNGKLTYGLIAALLAVIVTGDIGIASEGAADAAWVDRDSIQVDRVGGNMRVRYAVTNPTRRSVLVTMEAAVANLDGEVVLKSRREAWLRPGRTAYPLLMYGSVPEERVPESVVQYAITAGSHTERGSRSLTAVLSQLECRLVAYRDLLAGSTASVRVAAFNHASREPVGGAEVDIALAPQGAEEKAQTVFQGVTDGAGTVDARFEVPEDLDGKTDLIVTVTTAQLGTDRIVQPVTVKREAKVLLTTDKPMYQPGQLIQMRALCLSAADMTPEATRPLVFEVMDSKGNKVFKESLDTDEFGIAAADFQIASEVNLGGYIVRAVLGETETEKQVTVERYVLPKFKVGLKTDRRYYLPGETLKGEVQSDYFFGKPVAGGTVEIVASKFEIGFEEFARLEGMLNDDGFWEFELPLPEYFAGTPLEQGEASVRLEAFVTDTADHREEKVTMTPIAAAPLSIFAVPESGRLQQGLDNRVYLLVSYPDGSPADGAQVRVRGEGVSTAHTELTTDALGIATVVVEPASAESMRLMVVARDKQGRSGEKSFDLGTKSGEDGLIVRTDKALYRVGDTLHADVFTTKSRGTVYFDVLRGGQTVLTHSATVSAGRASMELDLDATVSGSVVFQAYMFTAGTDILRDTRLLYVNPADSLELAVDVDGDTHRPGETARVTFRVTDQAGKGTAAALGIAIVDESVFALQEIHPGLEKIYFTLEKEIMQPRYEIHGYDLDSLVKGEGPVPAPLPGDVVPVRWTDTQQEAARVLLASAPAIPEPPIRVNTFAEKQAKADEAIVERVREDYEHIQRAVMKYMKAHRQDMPEDMLGALLREKYLRSNELLDPWGNAYEFDFAHVQDWGGFFEMVSYGPDEVKGTADDIEWSPRQLQENLRRGGFARGQKGGVALFNVRRDLAEAAPAMAMDGVVAEKSAELEALGYLGADDKDTGGAASGAKPVRLREYFPETLLFEPALITDRRGVATLDVALADSITTWRMTTMASSRAGALGSTETPMRVFQDFFVDLDLPVALTQNDRVSIPVVLYNYLDEAQDVRLKFEVEPWFELDGDAERVIRLEAEEVRAMYFPIEVVELGMHRLTVYAYGSDMSDAIRRQIEVLPDGEEQNVTFSDRLSGRVEHTITIPDNAVEGASKILVRVFPGVYSQIVDGLDSMLRMPNGCFEQTSAATYPNILIVQYMKATDQINPELQMKAEGFINAGYQRLLAYEVTGGGYSWFGDAPANKVLTAWGLKEFYDMAEVHEVDPAVIDRTREWLLAQQEADGSWKPDASYLHAESWTGIQNSNALVTAYILEALLTTGDHGSGAQKAIDYLRANWQANDEAYTVALVANALVAWSPKDAWTAQVLEDLHALCVEDKETAHWKGGSGTVTFTHGDAADVETTALSAIAFMRAGKYPETVTKALTYLIQKKSAQGHWGSTQATILALKALMLSLGNRTETVDATVTVAINGETASELRVTPEDCDVMRLVDLGEQTKAGANEVTLSINGEGSMLYQVVGRYYTPWDVREGPQEAMTIDVEYDKTELAVNDLVTATVTVKNNRPAAAQMIIVDLGIPPGFQVVTPDLDKLVKDGILDKYELTGRQIIAYFEAIDANGTIEFSYGLRAKFPLRAQTPRSRVYEYYNPEVEGLATPETIVVE